jgi:hypothetical protein
MGAFGGSPLLWTKRAANITEDSPSIGSPSATDPAEAKRVDCLQDSPVGAHLRGPYGATSARCSNIEKNRGELFLKEPNGPTAGAYGDRLSQRTSFPTVLGFVRKKSKKLK